MQSRGHCTEKKKHLKFTCKNTCEVDTWLGYAYGKCSFGTVACEIT